MNKKEMIKIILVVLLVGAVSLKIFLEYKDKTENTSVVTLDSEKFKE